jgi:hypothetical protein
MVAPFQLKSTVEIRVLEFRILEFHGLEFGGLEFCVWNSRFGILCLEFAVTPFLES